MLCAIHQPNFFPWLGYFDKIRRADIFVFLDAVDYPRAGSGSMGSWLNRVKIAMQGEARWVGCPVRRMPLGSPISQAMIDDGQPWRAKLLRSLETNYRRGQNFDDAISVVSALLEKATGSLSEFNIGCIMALAAHFGFAPRFVRQTQIMAEGSATELLINIVRSVGATAYLAGGGAMGYQQDELFAANGIELVYQDFTPRAYVGADKFIPGLSVIDYIMNRRCAFLNSDLAGLSDA